MLQPADAAPVPSPAAPGRRALRLAPAALAVLLGAADTYVVVLALPDLMAGVGLAVDDLARAAPLVSGFLLGYVAVLPLAGRVSDAVGRTPVLVACLLGFALGSLVTASASTLDVAVAGRGLQGLGAGGLVPPTLALVADLWADRERGLPLGVVGAAQELGAVLGPLLGAAVLALADWRAIFWANLGAALVLAATLRSPAGSGPARTRGQVGALAVGLALTAVGAVGLALGLRPPAALAESVELGTLVVPLAGDGPWTSPLTLAACALVAAGLLLAGLALARAGRPAAGEPRPRRLADLDLPGVLLLAAALAGVVLTFAGAETSRTVVDDRWPLYTTIAVVAAAGFVVRQRTARSPLVPRGTLALPAARAALVANALVGVALVAVIVDVPVLARVTRFPDSQLGAALLLLEFLAPLPVGALVGGWALRRQPPWRVAAVGLTIAALALAATLTWDTRALYGLPAQLVLVIAGFGFGLAVAPVNAVLLAATPAPVHGLASALAVLARTVGMLVGLSVLTAVGLRVFAARQAALPSPFDLCPTSPTNCPAYVEASVASVVGEVQAVLACAAGALAVAAVVVALRLRVDRPLSPSAAPEVAS